ncbi:MAG: replication initiation protein [Legionellaceae bacterium]|nr:replication initiation protein [Legionellaceae bacterium]
MEITAKVKKPVEAIQCANTFSLLQRKMYNVLLANAAGNLFPEVTHRINMRTLCNLMGYRSNDYKTIKQKFRELRRMDIEWDVINEKGNNVWTNTSPLSLARVIEGEGICEYEFTPSLLPFLDRPAQYAKFSLAIQAKFKSGYGLALYENCERYRNIGYSRSFDIPTFRKLMGVGESEYLEFFALKRRVITIAMKEVNQYADFDVEGEYEKKGRTITAVKFLIKNKQGDIEISLPQVEVADDADKLAGKLKSYFGLKQLDIDKYIKKYGREYIDEKINTILDSDSFKKGLIKSMAGYLKTALSEDFQVGVSSKAIVEKQRRDRESKLSNQRAQEEKLGQLRKAYEYYLSKEIKKLIPKLTKTIKQEIFTEFEQYLGSGVYLALFQKEGLENVLVLDRFTEFARVQHPEILEVMMSFDDYLKQLTANV